MIDIESSVIRVFHDSSFRLTPALYLLLCVANHSMISETETYVPLLKDIYLKDKVDQLVELYRSIVGKKPLEATTGILDKVSENQN